MKHPRTAPTPLSRMLGLLRLANSTTAGLALCAVLSAACHQPPHTGETESPATAGTTTGSTSPQTTERQRAVVPLSAPSGPPEEAQAPSPEGLWAEAYRLVEEMPRFPGGADSLQRYLATHLDYPPQAVAAGTEGKVIIRFIVMADGRIGPVRADSSVVKSAPCLAREAVRLIEHMPRWTPGRHHGQAVPVECVLPVQFSLHR